jgi:hypothetical protein
MIGLPVFCDRGSEAMPITDDKTTIYLEELISGLNHPSTRSVTHEELFYIHEYKP